MPPSTLTPYSRKTWPEPEKKRKQGKPLSIKEYIREQRKTGVETNNTRPVLTPTTPKLQKKYVYQ